MGAAWEWHAICESSIRRGFYCLSLAGITGSIPDGYINVCCECCVLSGGGLSDGPITHLEESFSKSLIFTSCILQIIEICLYVTLYPLQFSLLPVLQTFKFLHKTILYAASGHTNLDSF